MKHTEEPPKNTIKPTPPAENGTGNFPAFPEVPSWAMVIKSINDPSFEKSIDSMDEKSVSNFILAGKREGFGALLIKLSPGALKNLLNKTSIEVLRLVLETMEEGENQLLEKKIGKEQVEILRNKAEADNPIVPGEEDLPVRETDLTDLKEDMHTKTEEVAGETSEEETLPHQIIIPGLEDRSTQPQTTKPDETDENETREYPIIPSEEEKHPVIEKYQEATKLIDEIEEMGYSVIPTALEEGSSHYSKTTEEVVTDLDNIISDLTELKKYIDETAEEYSNKTIPGGHITPYIGEVIIRCGYRFVPTRQSSLRTENGQVFEDPHTAIEESLKEDKDISDEERREREENAAVDEFLASFIAPQEKEVLKKWSRYLERKYPELAHPKQQ